MLGAAMALWVQRWDSGCSDGTLGAVMGCWVQQWDAGGSHGTLGAVMGLWVQQWDAGCTAFCERSIAALLGLHFPVLGFPHRDW